jgi:hypothetical protein
MANFLTDLERIYNHYDKEFRAAAGSNNTNTKEKKGFF